MSAEDKTKLDGLGAGDRGSESDVIALIIALS